MGHYISDAEGKLTKIAGKNYKAYMPLGMIFASTVMLEEISVKRLDGQSLSITGTYKDFCNWIMNQGANVPTCNISTYASEMTTYGQCGRYVINNTSTAQTSGSYTVPAYSIKLPTITEFVASNNGGKELGLAQIDQFKSHDHTQRILNTYGSNYYGYAHDMERMYSTNWTNSMPTGSTGGSETRPKNIRYPYYVVVAQGVNPIALADMQQTIKNVEELQDKASRTEQVKVVYDIYSDDEALKGNYPDGIQGDTWGGVSISAKAKYVRVHVRFYTVLFTNCIIDMSPTHWATPPSEINNMCFTKYQQTSGNNMYFFGGMNIVVSPRAGGGGTLGAREAFKIKLGTTNSYDQYQANADWRIVKVEELY